MHKKTDFALGLLLGGMAAVIAFNRMNPVQRRRLFNKFNRTVGSLKDNVIDYAFYANNELKNTSGDLKKGTENAGSLMRIANHRAKRFKNQVQNHWTDYSKDAASHLKSMLNQTHHRVSKDDIVLNAGEALHNSKTIIYYPNGASKSV